MRRLFALLLCVAFVMPVAGCGDRIGVKNPYEMYVTIDKEFSTLAEQYEVWYQAASPETKARWKKDIDPLFIEADHLLDVYQTVLLAGADPAAQIASLRSLKTRILAELAKKYDK